MEPLKIYDYLCAARERVLDAIRPLTPQRRRQVFPFGLGTPAATLTHIMISEWYYIERMRGRRVPPYHEWPIQYENPPEFSAVEGAWREQAPRVRSAIADERDWRRLVEYETFPDEGGKRYRIRVTAGDIVAQLALHETHHRAQLMSMLRMMGGEARPVQDIDYNDLMYERTEIT